MAGVQVQRAGSPVLASGVFLGIHQAVNATEPDTDLAGRPANPETDPASGIWGEVRDANGNPLQDGDTVVVIKDLKVKGSSTGIKAGTTVATAKSDTLLYALTLALDTLPYKLFQTPADTIDYLTHPTHYLTTNSVDLEGSGISCPSARSYIPTLVAFVKAHPDISSAAMI